MDQQLKSFNDQNPQFWFLMLASYWDQCTTDLFISHSYVYLIGGCFFCLLMAKLSLL